jgi:hypothetical protein
MNLKESMIRNSKDFKYSGTYLEENILLDKIATSYFKDKENFGKETINLYERIFGEEARILLSKLDENEKVIKPMLENNRLGIYEDVGFGGWGRAASAIFRKGSKIMPGAAKEVLTGAAKAVQAGNVAKGKALVQSLAKNSNTGGFLSSLLGGGLQNALSILGPILGGVAAARLVWGLLKKFFGKKKKVVQQQQEA